MGNVKATVFKHESYLTEHPKHSEMAPGGKCTWLGPRSTVPSRESTLEAAKDRKPMA